MENIKFKLVSFGDFLPRVQKVKWIIEPILPVGYVTVLGGQGGLGKSAFALHISDDLSGQGKKVLYIDGEMCGTIFKDRCTSWNLQNWQKIKTLEVDNSNIKPGDYCPPPETHCPKDIMSIKPILESYMPDLVVIDSLTTLIGDRNLSDASDVTPLYKNLTELSSKYQTAILLLAHTKKKANIDDVVTLNSIKGSGTITDLARSVLILDGDEDSYFRTLKHVKTNLSAKSPTYSFKMTSSGIEDFEEFSPLNKEDKTTLEIRPNESRIGQMKATTLKLLELKTPKKEIRKVLKETYNPHDPELTIALKWGCQKLGILYDTI